MGMVELLPKKTWLKVLHSHGVPICPFMHAYLSTLFRCLTLQSAAVFGKYWQRFAPCTQDAYFYNLSNFPPACL